MRGPEANRFAWSRHCQCSLFVWISVERPPMNTVVARMQAICTSWQQKQQQAAVQQAGTEKKQQEAPASVFGGDKVCIPVAHTCHLFICFACLAENAR